jgi:hypothetical protein
MNPRVEFQRMVFVMAKVGLNACVVAAGDEAMAF